MNHISQSLIRDMMAEKGYCGHYLNLKYNEGVRTEPTDAMVNGLFFEQAIIGATATGKRVEIPRSKTNGAKLKRETDLEEVITFAQTILEKNQVEFTRCQVYIERDNRSGHIDAIGTFHGQPYLFDLKYTGMSYDQYERELKWGDTRGNFMLQARQYQSITEAAIPFLFLVFGPGWCRFFEVPFDAEMISQHIELATECLETFNSMEYRPTADSRMCFACPLSDVCKVKNETVNVEQL